MGNVFMSTKIIHTETPAGRKNHGRVKKTNEGQLEMAGLLAFDENKQTQTYSNKEREI